MNTVICDECNNEFDIDIKEKRIDNYIKQLYFVCPHCGKEYLVTKVNKEIEDMQDKISYYADRAAQCKNHDTKQKHLDRMNELVEKKKRLMNELNNK